MVNSYVGCTNSVVIKHVVYASSYSDLELVELIKAEPNGAVDALNALLKRYEGQVYRLCLRYFRSPTDAEDACQEVLTRVFRRIDQFEGRSGFRTWLYRVTENQCRTLLRKQRQRQERELTGQALPDVNMEPLDFVDNFETKALVDKVLARLPASDREVLALRFREDLSFDKMAQHLNLRLSAAKMRLYRAMDHFKQECIVFGYDRLTTIS